jgi:hypothetical protein
MGVRTLTGSLFWGLLVFTIQAPSPSVAQDSTKAKAASTDGVANAKPGTTQGYSSAVNIAERLAGANNRFDLDANRIAQMRSLRVHLQGLKDILVRNDPAFYVPTIRMLFNELRTKIESDPTSLETPQPYSPPKEPAPPVAQTSPPQPGPAPPVPPNVPERSATPGGGAGGPPAQSPPAGVPAGDARPQGKEQDSEARIRQLEVQLRDLLKATARLESSAQSKPASTPAVAGHAVSRAGVIAQSLKSWLSSLVQSRENAIQYVSNQVNFLSTSIASLSSSTTNSPVAYVAAAPPGFGYSVQYGAIAPTTSGPGADQNIATFFPRTYYILTLIASGVEEVEKEDIRQAAEEMNSIETLLKQRGASDLEKKVDDLLTSLDNAIKQAEAGQISTEEEKTRLATELRNRDDLVTQSAINQLLVYAVYGMIASIALLFVSLRMLGEKLAKSIIRQRLLIEVLSMGFLLLTVIILGTGKLLNSEGLAALLGTIAGYIFARKAEEMSRGNGRIRSPDGGSSDDGSDVAGDGGPSVPTNGTGGTTNGGDAVTGGIPRVGGRPISGPATAGAIGGQVPRPQTSNRAASTADTPARQPAPPARPLEATSILAAPPDPSARVESRATITHPAIDTFEFVTPDAKDQTTEHTTAKDAARPGTTPAGNEPTGGQGAPPVPSSAEPVGEPAALKRSDPGTEAVKSEVKAGTPDSPTIPHRPPPPSISDQ